MTDKKTIEVANQRITITPSTQVEIMTSEEYVSSRRPIPFYNYFFWTDVCTVGFNQNNVLREYLLTAFSKSKGVQIFKGIVPKIEFSQSSEDGIRCWEDSRFKLSADSFQAVAQFLDLHIYVNDSDTKIELYYPHDHCLIIDALIDYVADEYAKAEKKSKSQSKLSKMLFGTETQQLTPEAQRVDHFLTEHKTYVDTFMNAVSERKSFRQQASGKNVLRIDSEYFFESTCDFDISGKYAEICNIRTKLQRSYNPGESDVDYALKWFCSAARHHIVTIKGDCESYYRYNCIVLRKTDFIEESQEYDHILVCPAGIVLIETKHWKGMVEIRTDGKWIRKPDYESAFVGVESPKFQMRRHEVLMQHILPNVPVHSILCFSNASTVINGAENFKDYPIITIDHMEEVLNDLCANGSYGVEEIDRMAAVIEAHKVHQESHM